MKLRHYQQDAVDAVIAWIRKSTKPCCVEAPTGAGKSWIIAAIAHWINKQSKKRVLVIAPSGELVEQDYEKYLATGEPASMFSASVGRKELRHHVVFGSPLTVANSLNMFTQYAAIIIDESHNLTPTIFKIIDNLRTKNPKLRVIGLTATPYRMNSGYIYANHYQRGVISDEETREPFFEMCVYDIAAQTLLDEGFLTPPVFDADHENYDTSELIMKKTGQWDQASIDKAFVGQGRKTSVIVADIVKKSVNRMGVMIFAATVQHAHEIAESLPGNITRIVTGETPKADREKIIAAFKARRIKYLVNVSVLTTGFDASHVDVVAILRATESAGLLTQIIGRGLRIDPEKKDCLILDYAENIERHFSESGDIFKPTIKAKRKTDSEKMTVVCPLCSHANLFGARPNDEGYSYTDDGYFADLLGIKITLNDVPLPSHFGRRCTGITIQFGNIERCSYKWSFKECPNCEHENDIAARFCSACKFEIVDPNEKLKELHAKLDSDPYRVQFAPVANQSMRRHIGRLSGDESLRVDYLLDDDKGNIVSQWIIPNSGKKWIQSKWDEFCINNFGIVYNDLNELFEKGNNSRQAVEVAYRKEKGQKYLKFVGATYD